MKNDTPCHVIGEFINITATFEYIVNMAIESILDSQKLIDHFQRQEMDTRVELLKQLLLLAKTTYEKLEKNISLNKTGDYDAIIRKLDELIAIHNECKNCRNLIAHSPMFVDIYENTKSGQLYKEHKIVNSRRIKKNSKNSAQIREIKDLNNKFLPKTLELFNVLSEILVYCHPVYQIKEAKRERM